MQAIRADGGSGDVIAAVLPDRGQHLGGAPFLKRFASALRERRIAE
jgi:hypothetical protein